MSVNQVDKDPAHLYPEFRRRVEVVISRVNERIRGEDAVVYAETYRSVERQLWLYGQGRTRPGNVVTWVRSPRFHGCGLAADLMFRKKGYGAPQLWWKAIFTESVDAGLCNPAWHKGDFGHVQWDADDIATRTAAAAWCRAGFTGTVVDTGMSRDVQVAVDGRIIPDAMPYVENGKTFLWIRSILDEIGAVVIAVGPDSVHVAPRSWGEDQAVEVEIPAVFRESGGRKRGFVAVSALRSLGCEVEWNPATKIVSVTTAQG